MTSVRRLLVKDIAIACDALRNCLARGNSEWATRWTDHLEGLEDKLPSGGGFDAGTKIAIANSSRHRLVLETSYHPISSLGYYEDWIELRVVVQPCLVSEFTIDVSRTDGGELCDSLEDFVVQAFDDALTQFSSTYPHREASDE